MFISFHGDESVGPSDLLNTAIVSGQAQEVGVSTVQSELLMRVTDTERETQSDTGACANGVCSLNWSPVKPQLSN